MLPHRKPFKLPMTVNVCGYPAKDGQSRVAHALEFDLACVGKTDEEALDKLRLALRIYVEYGLVNDIAEDIIYPAPDEFWQILAQSKSVNVLDEIDIMDWRVMIHSATPIPAHELGQPA
jgi:hypothetical protein